MTRSQVHINHSGKSGTIGRECMIFHDKNKTNENRIKRSPFKLYATLCDTRVTVSHFFECTFHYNTGLTTPFFADFIHMYTYMHFNVTFLPFIPIISLGIHGNRGAWSPTAFGESKAESYEYLMNIDDWTSPSSHWRDRKMGALLIGKWIHIRMTSRHKMTEREIQST